MSLSALEGWAEPRPEGPTNLDCLQRYDILSFSTPPCLLLRVLPFRSQWSYPSGWSPACTWRFSGHNASSQDHGGSSFRSRHTLRPVVQASACLYIVRYHLRLVTANSSVKTAPQALHLYRCVWASHAVVNHIWRATKIFTISMIIFANIRKSIHCGGFCPPPKKCPARQKCKTAACDISLTSK